MKYIIKSDYESETIYARKMEEARAKAKEWLLNCDYSEIESTVFLSAS